jgi:hypothetical protein
LLLSRQHGILESARLSAAKARGRLPMVFGLLLIGGLTVLSLLWIGSLVVSIVSVVDKFPHCNIPHFDHRVFTSGKCKTISEYSDRCVSRTFDCSRILFQEIICD